MLIINLTVFAECPIKQTKSFEHTLIDQADTRGVNWWKNWKSLEVAKETEQMHERGRLNILKCISSVEFRHSSLVHIFLNGLTKTHFHLNFIYF